MRNETLNYTSTEIKQLIDERDDLRKECQRLKEEVRRLYQILRYDWARVLKESHEGIK